MAHGDAREGNWRGNWRMEWVASTLHTTSEHDVSSITTADAHTSAASSRLYWCPCRFKRTRPFRRKTKSGFCACAITFHFNWLLQIEHLPRRLPPPFFTVVVEAGCMQVTPIAVITLRVCLSKFTLSALLPICGLTLSSPTESRYRCLILLFFCCQLGYFSAHSTNAFNTLRTGLLNCLNARSRGLNFRHRASCI